MKEPQRLIPIKGVSNIIKLQRFQQELFEKGKYREVRLMQLTSQIPMNYMFLAIEGKVYKYDLVSKECLFEFNTNAEEFLQLYDDDDKLLASDLSAVRLWDFFDHKEEWPELVTVLEFNDPVLLRQKMIQQKLNKSKTQLSLPGQDDKDENEPIDCVKVNKVCEDSGDKKNVFFYVVAQKNKFRVYHSRLEPLIEGDINPAK